MGVFNIVPHIASLVRHQTGFGNGLRCAWLSVQAKLNALLPILLQLLAQRLIERFSFFLMNRFSQAIPGLAAWYIFRIRLSSFPFIVCARIFSTVWTLERRKFSAGNAPGKRCPGRARAFVLWNDPRNRRQNARTGYGFRLVNMSGLADRKWRLLIDWYSEWISNLVLIFLVLLF